MAYHPLRTFGIVGLALGLAVMAAGSIAGELGGFLTGYGLLMVLSAGYLLAGLALRAAVARRGRPLDTRVALLGRR